MMIRLTLAGLAIVAAVCPALGYTCGALGGDPRAMALGAANTVIASGALGVWSNPAAAARLMAKEAAVAGTSLSSDRKVLLAALVLGGKRHGWFFGARWAGVSGVERYTSAGTADGSFGAGDVILAAGYARALTPLMFVGGRVKLLNSYLDEEQAWGAGMDVGFLYMPLPPLLKLGVAMEDLGTFARWAGSDHTETTPATVRGGLAIGLVQGKLSLNTELEQVLDGSPLATLLGLQVKLGGGLVLRAGLLGGHATFGFGLDAGRVMVDVAMFEDALGVRPTTSIALSTKL
jgi:hypothetical protein